MAITVREVKRFTLCPVNNHIAQRDAIFIYEQQTLTTFRLVALLSNSFRSVDHWLCVIANWEFKAAKFYTHFSVMFKAVTLP